MLDQALASGTVKRTADGRSYLDEMAVADRKEGQGFMALLIMLVIASVIASAAVLAAVQRPIHLPCITTRSPAAVADGPAGTCWRRRTG